MSRNMLAAMAVSLTLILQAGCVTKAATNNCTIVGVKNLSPQISEGELCRSFEEQLAKKLAEMDASDRSVGLDIAIDLTRKGSAIARLTAADGNATSEFPEVAVDVMDRDLRKGDVDQLAKEVAKMLTKQ